MAPKMSDDPFAQSMSELRRHIKTCYECRYAFSDNLTRPLCHAGTILSVRLAYNCERVLKLKLTAASAPGGKIYACPDLSKHGDAYAISATPFTISGVQGELF